MVKGSPLVRGGCSGGSGWKSGIGVGPNIGIPGEDGNASAQTDTQTDRKPQRLQRTRHQYGHCDRDLEIEVDSQAVENAAEIGRVVGENSEIEIEGNRNIESQP